MKYLILGVIQGLTEFLPISSSGHLLIAQKIMRFNGGYGLGLIIFAHLGTLLVLFSYFFKEIKELLRSIELLKYTFFATLITGIEGLFFKKYFEFLFDFYEVVKFTLIVNGFFILLASFLCRDFKERSSFRLKEALGFGIVQGLSVIPGISRSGITISYLLLKKFDIESAFKLSFLTGIPAILGAFILEAREIIFASPYRLGNYFFCLIISFISGFFALIILKRFLYRAKFYYFGYYCILVGIILFFIK
ncbi:MAG: undecaprenyl-diphosphate phosphatase [Candidatus Omnitrophica bacterium]|nr:undecaprenyl-diphosphate phosphatase [Candidatus Omnitrophota bacterium]